jgi:hypothetical protein
MPAPIALIEMTTQDRGPAVTNVSERFPLLARQHGNTTDRLHGLTVYTNVVLCDRSLALRLGWFAGDFDTRSVFV